MEIREAMRLCLLPIFILPLLVANGACADGLPPDPGEAGMRTLAGVDSDNDGVRDDVQRWIALNHPESQKVRAALTQKAKIYQQYILNAADPILSRGNAIYVVNSVECLSYVSPNKSDSIEDEFKAIFFNTPSRAKAQAQADHHSSGQVFELYDYDIRYQACEFDPDAMAD